MEPDLGGQEKARTLIWNLPEPPVAMEPDLGGQEKLSTRAGIPGRGVPVAMEPDLGGQEKV